MAEELPHNVRERAIALARSLRDTESDETERTLTTLLERYGFRPRIRFDDAVLVCYPTEWEEDGMVHPTDIDDIDRAIELPFTEDEKVAWETIATENARIVEDVRSQYGEAHGVNAEAFADFMNNHRAQSIRNATDKDVEEFLTNYYQRNVWPSDEQASLVETSVAIARRSAGSSL